jgi:hypothetical protein
MSVLKNSGNGNPIMIIVIQHSTLGDTACQRSVFSSVEMFGWGR